MTQFLFVLEAALALAAGFFLLYKKDAARAQLASVLLAKTCVLSMAVSGSFAAAPVFLAACAGMIISAAYLNTAACPANESRGNRDYALFIAAAAFIFLMSGCARGQGQFPELKKEINLGFVPSRIEMAGRDEIYVGTEKDNQVFVYNLQTGARTRSIKAGYNPSEILVTDKKVYIANEKSASVTIYDPVSGTSENMDSGGEFPSALALNQEKNLLYVANTGSGNVAILDLAARRVKNRIITGKWPSDLYLTPDNRYLFVSCKFTNTVQLIDAVREEYLFTKIETGVSPAQLIPIDKRTLAIVNEWEYSFNQQSAVNIFDMKDYGLKATIRVDGGIFNGVLSKSRRYLFISVPLKDEIIFVDIKKRQTLYSMEFKDQTPKWLALSRDGRELYAAMQNGKRLAVIILNDLI
jgi:hypothetical protein